MENERFQEIVIEHLVRLSQSDVEIKDELGSVKDQLRNLEATVLRIENDHGEKLQALIDAYEAQRDVNERVDNVLATDMPRDSWFKGAAASFASHGGQDLCPCYNRDAVPGRF